ATGDRARAGPPGAFAGPRRRGQGFQGTRGRVRSTGSAYRSSWRSTSNGPAGTRGECGDASAALRLPVPSCASPGDRDAGGTGGRRAGTLPGWGGNVTTGHDTTSRHKYTVIVRAERPRVSGRAAELEDVAVANRSSA